MSRSVRLLVALIAALVLAACGAEAEGEAPAAPEDSDTAAESDAAAAEQKSDDADTAKETAEKLQDSAGEDEVEIPEELPVIESRNVSEEGAELEIDLNSVTADGEVMTVLFTVRNVGDQSQTLNQMFDDGSAVAPLDDDAESSGQDLMLAYTTDGVTVIDPAEAMMYRAAYDSSGHCACSSNLVEVTLDSGDSTVLSTSFAAPPESTETVTVDIPLTGSFENVPLTR